jgi:predicted metal-dependent peptidase
MKLTAEQRVQKAHVKLMGDPKYCLYSGIFLLGKTEVRDGVATAYTDGRNTIYGREFVDKLSDAELCGLILHENLHKAFRHLTTWQLLYQENPQLANMACDYVINLMIFDCDPKGESVRLPEGGLLDEKFRGMDSGQVFRILKDEQGEDGGDGEGGEQSEQGDGDGQGDGGDAQSTQGKQSDKPSKKQNSLDEHGWEQAKEMSVEEKDKLDRDIDQALRQGALLAGRMGGKTPREINELLGSKVDWREVLRDFITSFCVDKDVSTWRKPNRRWVGQDVYLPSLVGEAVGRLVIGVDTSGSIDAKAVGAFLGQVQKVCQTVTPEAIDLVYWDSRVCAHEVYEPENFDSLLTTTKPRGGGGTSPTCVRDFIKDKRIKPECVIMLTDGYVDSWGDDWGAPVLWGITTKNIKASVGTTIHIGE